VEDRERGPGCGLVLNGAVFEKAGFAEDVVMLGCIDGWRRLWLCGSLNEDVECKYTSLSRCRCETNAASLKFAEFLGDE
jgi:hypothetical protein